jgi:tRNA pseudouridine55 synthase
VHEPFGFLNIHKPPGMTSHDVVAKLRRGLKLKKVGHAGTLDPLATGVLIVCVGGATRLSEYVMSSRKRYRAVIRAGVETDTYDADGEITRQVDASQLMRQQVEAALEMFIGELQQVPPMYSAIKQGGRKLYDLARAGQTVELQPRPVTIYALSLTEWAGPDFTLDVECSAGTYIRSLAFDLGRALGVGAHLTDLTRLASGAFMLEQATGLDALLDDPHWQSHLISPDAALADWLRLTLTEAEEREILYGRRIQREGFSDSLIFAYSHSSKQLVAILQAQDGWLLPHKVFSPAAVLAPE